MEGNNTSQMRINKLKICLQMCVCVCVCVCVCEGVRAGHIIGLDT